MYVYIQDFSSNCIVFRTISQYYRSYKSKLLKLVLVPKIYLKEIYLKERYPQ